MSSFQKSIFPMISAQPTVFTTVIQTLFAPPAALNATPSILGPYHCGVIIRNPPVHMSVIQSFGGYNNLDILLNLFLKHSTIPRTLNPGCSFFFPAELLKTTWKLHFCAHLLHLEQICMICKIVLLGRIYKSICVTGTIWYLVSILTGLIPIQTRLLVCCK